MNQENDNEIGRQGLEIETGKGFLQRSCVGSEGIDKERERVRCCGKAKRKRMKRERCCTSACGGSSCEGRGGGRLGFLENGEK